MNHYIFGVTNHGCCIHLWFENLRFYIFCLNIGIKHGQNISLSIENITFYFDGNLVIESVCNFIKYHLSITPSAHL